METLVRKVYQSGEKVTITGHYDMIGDQNNTISTQQYTLKRDDFFPNCDGHNAYFVLIERLPSQDGDKQSTRYSMPWQP